MLGEQGSRRLSLERLVDAGVCGFLKLVTPLLVLKGTLDKRVRLPKLRGLIWVKVKIYIFGITFDITTLVYRFRESFVIPPSIKFST